MRTLALLLTLLAAPVVAQAQAPSILGTWRVAAGKEIKEGPREVIIRADSSASWGKETVRWRVKGEQISIVLGGEWETYKLKVKKDALTLSGGDLPEPITLKKVGPPTERPAGVKIPADPDGE